MLALEFSPIRGARCGMSKLALILGSCLWIGVLAGLIFVWQSQSDAPEIVPQPQKNADGITVEQNESSVKIGFPAKRLPDFKFENCTGGTYGLEDLKGKRWVASFIFTSCAETCPMISRAMMEVHDRVEQSAPDVMFVSFTVYPRVDTAEVLKNYGETFTKGNWDRWKFLTASQQQIYELIVKGFGLYVKESVEELKRPGFEVAHSNRVVLVNEDGIPVGTFLGTQPEDMVELRRILNGKKDFPEPGVGSGFTISSPNGGTVSVEFEAQPVIDDGVDNEETAPSEESADDAKDDSAGALDSELSKPSEPEARSALEHNRSIDERMPAWARVLPTVNSGFNTLSAILLMLGLVSIKRGRRETHKKFMISAFLTSAVFLACYLTYHYALGKYTGEHGKKFPGEGIAAVIYQLILWPHIVLAVFVPLLAIRVFQHAFAERWDAHKRLAKITFPIWMFVSVTGVIIYGMLYHWPVPVNTAS